MFAKKSPKQQCSPVTKPVSKNLCKEIDVPKCNVVEKQIPQQVPIRECRTVQQKQCKTVPKTTPRQVHISKILLKKGVF